MPNPPPEKRWTIHLCPSGNLEPWSCTCDPGDGQSIEVCPASLLEAAEEERDIAESAFEREEKRALEAEDRMDKAESQLDALKGAARAYIEEYGRGGPEQEAVEALLSQPSDEEADEMPRWIEVDASGGGLMSHRSQQPSEESR